MSAITGIAPARNLEVRHGGPSVPPSEGINTEHVSGSRLLAVEREDRFEMLARLVGKTRASCVLGRG